MRSQILIFNDDFRLLHVWADFFTWNINDRERGKLQAFGYVKGRKRFGCQYPSGCSKEVGFIKSLDRGIDDDDEFTIGGLNVKAINVIGHSYDSVCFLMKLDGRTCLFNGDTVQYGGVLGLINYPMCSMADYHIGLPKLKGLNVEGLFPGHGIMTLKDGQTHIDKAITYLDSIFMPQAVGQVVTSIL